MCSNAAVLFLPVVLAVRQESPAQLVVDLDEEPIWIEVGLMGLHAVDVLLNPPKKHIWFWIQYTGLQDPDADDGLIHIKDSYAMES